MRIAKIKPNDVVNGVGIMVSVFVQGCPHHCKGCFNKETWDFNGGRELLDIDLDHIVHMLDANGVHRDLAILGGEPMAKENYFEVLLLCAFVKNKRPDTKIYLWSGYTIEQLLEMYGLKLLKIIDFLIDGKFIEEEKDLTLKLRGSRNQRVIDIQEFLKLEERKR